MFTLQILDQGQTFFYTLEDGRPVVLGGEADADLRLRADAVAGRHARIEFADGAPNLVALGGSRVTVNGRAVRRAPLVLGDRIELGTAVILVGRAVARPARPEDVLHVPPATGRAARPRRTHRWVPFAAALLAVLGVVVVMLQTEPASLPAAFHDLDRLRRAGSFELARARLAELRSTWAGSDQARTAALTAEAGRIDAVETAVLARKQAILDRSAERSYAQFHAELQEEERSEDEVARQAARIVRASLSELLRTAGRPPLPAPVARQEPPAADAPPPVATTASTPDAEVPSVLQDAERLAGEGLYRQALDALDAALAGATESAAGPLRQRRAELQAAARAALDALLARSRQAAADGRLEQGLADLGGAEHRFPPAGEFAALPDALRELRQQLALARAPARPATPPAVAAAPAVDEAARAVTLASLQELLHRIREGEAAGDFAGTEQLLRQGAELVRARDPDFAERLQQRAAEFALLSEFHAQTAALLAGGRRFEVELRAGGKGTLHGSDGSALLLTTADGEQRRTWLDLADSGVARIVEQGRLAGRAVLGAASLLYRNGAREQAEALLARAVRADGKLQPDVGSVLAAGRGEVPDPGGYVLTKDGFVAASAIAAEKAAQKLLARLDSVLRNRDHRVRQAFLDEALAQGPSALGALVRAFRTELEQQVAQLERSSLRHQVERIADQRQQLDEARKHAKELIFDEARYFYPYRPPQVPPDRYAEYVRVQAEVDRRVAAVRALWHDDRFRVKVPASLQDSLARLDWVAGVLADLGELDPAVLGAIEWARALPPGATVGVQNHCRTLAERQELERWQRIAAYNEKVATSIDAAERELLQITNDYRAMFRHPPLALNRKIRAAAHGHAEEMSRLGYFSHFSPTPGRRTPFDRMKLAGYEYGVSENIALHGSAAGAHDAWCHSSGHHRNLLSPSHTEFGIGALGRCWVQNFGQGVDYQTDPAWAAVEPAGR